MMNDARRLFWWIFWGSLLLKLGLAAWLPLTGDEAYFYLWGKYPAGGYYDHPPMIGWWLHLLLYFGHAEWWLRLPAVLLSSLIGWGIYRFLRARIEPQLAAWLTILYLLSPMNLIMVLVATDTPLIIFSFFSAMALYRAVESGAYRWFVLSGVLLGLAFLSKYFAVLLGIAYGVYLLLINRNRRNVTGLLLLFLSVLPFAAFTVWWNYYHCWDNILFNLYNRQGGEPVGLDGLLTFTGMMLYLVTPVLLWYGWVQRTRLLQQFRSTNLFHWLWLLPMALFALLSLSSQIGLHWVLAFYPFMFLSLAQVLDERQLKRSSGFMAVFSGLHLLPLVIVLLIPIGSWKSSEKLHHDLVLGTHTGEVWRAIKPYVGERALATRNYAYSSILEYKTGRHFAVFGEASKHGRQDDILTDFRQLDGKGIVIMFYSTRSIPQYRRYFDHVSIHTIKVRDTTNTILVGDGFRYSLYRDEILELVKKQYYRMPSFLPSGACYFYDRYYPQQAIERLSH